MRDYTAFSPFFPVFSSFTGTYQPNKNSALLCILYELHWYCIECQKEKISSYKFLDLSLNIKNSFRIT